jgi:hypothetical protein
MVPDIRWPPDQFQLAELVHKTHWVMEQAAYDLSRGGATREQLDAVAHALEGLAPMLRAHPAPSLNDTPEAKDGNARPVE